MPRGQYIPAPDKGAEARALVAALLGHPWQWGDTSKAAAMIGVRPSYLSPYLTGKRRLTDSMRAKLAAKAKE
jgi:plasmid maintenance system antidote protein VapI